VAVLHLAALAEQGVRLVEQEDRAAILGRIEDPAQVLLGLSNVLTDDTGQIDRYRSSRSSLASTSAAIVFPVPLTPANKALIPRPRADRAAKPQSS